MSAVAKKSKEFIVGERRHGLNGGYGSLYGYYILYYLFLDLK